MHNRIDPCEQPDQCGCCQRSAAQPPANRALDSVILAPDSELWCRTTNRRRVTFAFESWLADDRRVVTSTLPFPRYACSGQGLFLAPTIVGESLKGAFLLAEIFGGTFGLRTNPPPPTLAPPPVGHERIPEAALPGRGQGGEEGGEGGSRGRGGVGGRTDIVQAVELGSRERLVRFCETVQRLSPIDAHVKPGEEPGASVSRERPRPGPCETILPPCLVFQAAVPYFMFLCRSFFSSLVCSVMSNMVGCFFYDLLCLLGYRVML